MRNASVLAGTIVACAFALVIAHANVAKAQRASDDPAPATRGTVVMGPAIALGDAVRAPLWSITDAHATTPPNGPIVGGGATFFGDAFGNDRPLVAIDLQSGAVRWTFHESATPGGYANGLVFAATAATQRFDHAHVVAVDARSGRERWTSPGTWVAAVRQLVVVIDGSHLEARDGATGALRWRSVWGGSTPHEARLIGSTLLLHTTESGATMVDVFFAYDMRDGRARWVRSANAIAGVLGDARVVLDTTWEPGAYANYAPLQTAIVGLADGSVTSTFAYAPDRERYVGREEHSAHFPSDVAADASSVLFRLGDDATYRYSLGADPAVTAATRYAFRAALPLDDGTWLVRTTDGRAGIARFDPSRATVRSFASVAGVTFSTVDRGYALVVARDRALVFRAGEAERALATRLPCATVTRAFVADGAFVVACGGDDARVAGLALPSTQRVDPVATPIPIRSMPPHRPFTPKVTTFTMPTRFTKLRDAAFDAHGALWICENALFAHFAGDTTPTDRIARIASDGTIAEFDVPTIAAGVAKIVRGPDDAMWFTESSALKLGRIDTNGAIREYALPSDLDVVPFRAGPIPQFPDPALVPARRHPIFARPKLGGLAPGADGALWVTAPFANALVRMLPDGSTREFPLPSEFAFPGALAPGPGGTLWFTARDAIGRFTIADGARRFPVDANRQALTSIAWGPDGNVWFSFFDGRIGRVADGKPVKIFRGPTIAAPNGPLIGGCDGALYMADSFRPALWRVSTNGDFDERDVPYAIGALARSPACELGFSEAQGPAEAHAGTISP